MAPRGLSAEEKRVRLLEIFHETKDFYQLKELEKLGPKMKGIVSQSVKEVLQSLVDDGLVQGDKIGSSNFYWSFPSQRGVMIQARLAKAKELRENQQKQLIEIKESIRSERSTRIESESRSHALVRLADLQKQVIALEKELNAYGDCDPVKIEEKKRAVILAKEAALRWTGTSDLTTWMDHQHYMVISRSAADNYGTLLSYFVRQNGIDPAEIRRFLEIDEDYEDIY